MAKKAEDVPAEGILNRVQQCKFGGHAQHTARCTERGTERGALAQAQVEAAQEVCAVSVSFSTLFCL